MSEQATEPQETAEGQKTAVETEAAEETAKPAETSLFKGKTFQVSAKDGSTKTLKGDETLADVEAREKAETEKAEKAEKPKEAGKKEGEKPKKDSGKGEGSEPPEKPEDQKPEPPSEGTDDLIKPDDPKGVKKRIEKAVTRQREAERRAETLQKRLDDQEARLDALETGKAKPEGESKKPGEAVETGADEAGKPVRPARPKDGDFDNYEDYEKAAEKYENDLSEYFEKLADWKADQKVREYAAEQQTKALETEDKKLIDEAVKKYPDFIEIAIKNDLEYTETMAETIYGSQKFAELAYYIGEHPEEAAKIAKLDPIQQVRELTTIELLGLQDKSKSTETDNDAQPAKPEKKDEKPPGAEGLKRTTQADEPIKPVNAAGTAAPFDPATASVKALQAHMNSKRIAKVQQLAG